MDVATRLLECGDQVYAAGRYFSSLLSQMLGRADMKGPVVEVKETELPLSDSDRSFLCRKAIGWLIHLPIAATSFVLSVMRQSSEVVVDEVGPILRDMLLDNYKTALDYAKSIHEDDSVYPSLLPLIEEAEAYLAAWSTVPRVREFDPGDHQQRIQHLRRADEMHQIHKTAHEKSTFASLFKKATVLHGSGMMLLVRDPDGAMRPIETPMNAFSLSVELPRLSSIDPVGFDYKLRLYRTERRRT